MTEFNPTLPFVLLDDARVGGAARLFTGLDEQIVATTLDEVRPALDRLRHATGHRAGFIGFEAGYALEPGLAAYARPAPGDLPLMWFGRFADSRIVDVGVLPDGPAGIGPLAPDIDERDHAAMVGLIAGLIASGDIYQANLTFGASVSVSGHPIALYRRLRRAQAAPHGALVHTGAAWILSLSPELFFTLEQGRLTTRPMKGTARRGVSASDDDAAAAALAADPKNRAENLMIVDLLRNDLSRVAVAGSVAVPQLFAVERYPTILQMTSTITATARPDLGAVEVIEALFPCGSITGAPKIRAMQVIAAVEPAPRGLYTGSIGAIDAGGDATFNVAIRTLVITRPGTARIGLGSGIVADSEAADEWRECLAKARFLDAGVPAPDLIETMRCMAGTIALFDLHLDRLAASARFLGYPIDLAAVRRAVIDAVDGATGRVRLMVSATGDTAVQVSSLPPPWPPSWPAPSPGPVEVALCPLPVAADDWRLRHKTSDRAFYDDARVASGAVETIFVRSDGRLTEGSFTNIFVPRGGVLLTPPTSDGLLPGVLRAQLLADGRAVEASLTAADLASGFLIGNALRGLRPARLRTI